MDTMTVNGVSFRILRLLGHGKGGYSYLAEHEGQLAVLKQIHHEPCDYYCFGDKLAAERGDYARLCEAGIRIPRLLAIDEAQERILKQYIPGPTAAELLQAGEDLSPLLPQLREMADQARAAGLNIDYYPTNFVLCEGLLTYIDYECNPYMEEWSLERWGLPFWTK